MTLRTADFAQRLGTSHGDGGRLAAWLQRARASSSGLTLVEMMVSLLILSVILTAAAAGLITFSQQAVSNERRVQATAHLSQLHEELQALPWDLAVLYEVEVNEFLEGVADDVDGLEPNGVNPGAEDWRLNGEPLVLEEGGCEVPSAVDCDRFDLVPLVVDDSPEAIDGREFLQIITLVTSVVDEGDPEFDPDAPAARRFTTIVTWEVLGTTYTQRFESMRAPTASELEPPEAPEILSFILSPSIIRVNEDGESGTSVDVVGRFSRGMDAARVRFPCYLRYLRDVDGDEVEFTFARASADCVIDLTGVGPLVDGRRTEFTGTIQLEDQDDKYWVLLGDDDGFTVDFDDYEGTLDPDKFELEGERFGTDPVQEPADVIFIDEDGASAPVITDAFVSRDKATIATGAGICDPFTVTALVSGVDVVNGGTVTATFRARNNDVSEPMRHGGGNQFTLRFEGSSPWNPSSDGKVVTFTIRAENPEDDAQSGTEISPQVELIRKTGQC